MILFSFGKTDTNGKIYFYVNNKFTDFIGYLCYSLKFNKYPIHNLTKTKKFLDLMAPKSLKSKSNSIKIKN